MNKFLQGALLRKAGLCANDARLSMILLLLTSLYALPLQAEETLKNINVSIVLEQATIRQALNALEKQTDYKFFYSSDQIDSKRKVSVNFHGNMEDALQLLLGKEISYSISGKHIILKKRLMSQTKIIPDTENDRSFFDTNALMTSSVSANGHLTRELAISGTVTDDNQEPLPGVNVLLKGTTIGTTTDATGTFNLVVPDASAVLIFSFIGYKSVELSIGNQTNIIVVLHSDTETLDEVVVVGYGSVKKSDLTGAVSSISRKSLGDRQVSSIAQLIQGQAAGVDVSQGKSGYAE